MFRTPNRSLTALLLALAVHSVVAVEASASTILVNSTADIVADDGVCTLREAVIAANTNVPSGVTVGECAAGEPTDPVTDLPIDEIVFVNLPGPETYSLTIVGDDDLAATGDLDILESLTITGNGASGTIIQGISAAPNQQRVFSINAAFPTTVVIQSVSIKFGFDVQAGGGILNYLGNVVVKDSIITQNGAGFGGGGIANVGGGLVTVIDSGVSFNYAPMGGGIYNHGNSQVVVNGSEIGDNFSTCQENECEAYGGGIFTSGGAVTLIDARLVANQAVCTGDPCKSRGGGLYAFGSVVQVLGGVILVNTAECGDGDVFPLTQDCQAQGGGIYNIGRQPVLIQDATVSRNQVRCLHADCDDPGASREARGGGIFNAGTLTVRRSTLSKNVARGGGVAFGAGLANFGDATIVNSTFSGNLSICLAGPNCFSWGGGFLQFDAEASAEIRFSTFAGNVNHYGNSGVLRGGGIAVLTGSIVIRHSIVAKNSTDNCYIGSGVASATNLDDDGTCAGFTLSNVNPHIGSLQMNGGPTETHRLLPFSPAIDAASSCDGVTTDQRGTSRPQSSACDLGAYERLSVGALTPALEELLTAIGEVQNADISRRLLAPLREIPRLLGDGRPNDGAVCGRLNAFRSQVGSAAARGELTRDEAARLARLALSVQREAGCAR